MTVTDMKEGIGGYQELKHRIILVSKKRVEEEEKLKKDIKEIYYSLQPIVMLKKALYKLSGDTPVQKNITTLGIQTGANYLIGKLFSRNSSLKGYFSSIFFERIIAGILNRKNDIIFSAINRLGKLFKQAA